MNPVFVTFFKGKIILYKEGKERDWKGRSVKWRRRQEPLGPLRKWGKVFGRDREEKRGKGEGDKYIFLTFRNILIIMYDVTLVLPSPQNTPRNSHVIIQGKRRVVQEGRVTFDYIKSHDQKLATVIVASSFSKRAGCVGHREIPTDAPSSQSSAPSQSGSYFSDGWDFQAF